MAVDISKLDPEVQKYIKELRDENADRRKSYKVYEDAFAAYDEPQQKGLLHMIQMLAEDTEAGALLFRELADNILGETEETPKEDKEDMAKNEETEETDIKAIVAAAVAEALEAQDAKYQEFETKAEEEEFNKAVEYWEGEITKLGYTPNTPEAADLFFMANKLGTSDLKLAHEKLVAYNEFVGAGKEEEEEEEEGGEEEEEKTFPKASGKGAGAPQVRDEIDFKDSGAVRDRLMAMLDSAE
jgi:hypothetical protein